MIRRLLRQTFRLLVAVVLLGLVVGGIRILTYHQTDDVERTARKDEYLGRVAELGAAATAPNIVVVFFDDLGYGDLGAYGARAIRTPHIDRLAAEGLLFRSAYAASPYCSASRAGLLTGRHAVRAGMHHVLQAPWTWQDTLLKLGGRNRRLPAEEITLSEVLSAAGYATAIYGKWHLGHRSPSRPTDRGFDHFWGLYFSNDQGEPEIVEERAGVAEATVVEGHPVDQTTLTRRYTERAVEFIEANAARPFFLYLPHTFPHVPLHLASDRRGASDRSGASDRRGASDGATASDRPGRPDGAGRSPAGLYGDVVEELDESVGAVAAALERSGVADRTLVLVSSDNGPWFQGSRGELRGRKFDVFEGGTRVPLVTWWPGVIGGAIVEEPVSLLDLFPTVLELAGLPLPADRAIDGLSLAASLTEGEPVAERAIVFHQLGVPRAIRRGRFKYHARHAVNYGNPMNWAWSPDSYRGPWLFDLPLDPAESWDVSTRHPEIVRRLASELAAWRADLEREPRGWR